MTDWFVPVVPVGDAPRTRLYVFPHAGGGPSSLTALAFPDEVEPWSVNLPGRQARLTEPPRTDLEPLVDELAKELLAREETPYALFGYCSGAMLAYLVCRRVHALGGAPVRLLVGSFPAPDIAVPLRRLHTLPSELFWESLLDLGGVPDELAGLVKLRPVLEPALRADFELIAGYRHEAGPPMTVPITVLYGRHDESVSRGGLLGWRRQSTHRPVLRELDASHWLVEDAPADLVAAIADELGGDR